VPVAGFLRRLFGLGPAERGEPVDLGDARGDLPPEGIALHPGPGVDVVGTSYQRHVIERLMGGPHPAGVRATRWARLAPAADDPKDPDAIVVLIEGELVGHLPRIEAKRYRPVLLDYAAARRGAYVRVDVRGGMARDWRDKSDFGLTVYLDSPERQARLLAAADEKDSTPTGA
jgi:hypothetical protein